MKLPNGEYAIVDIAKLRDYCLSPTHQRGKHKARVFLSVFGLRNTDAEELRSALLDAARTSEAVVSEQDAYGVRYIVDFDFKRLGSRRRIRSSWIILKNTEVPRLSTCYVL